MRLSAIDNFMLNPIDTQVQVFNNLIGGAQFTDYGKKHDFNNINTIADFKKAVPVNDYETLKPYIEEILNGKQNVLWSSPISWFAKSSGTTSDKSKFIPVSKEAMDDCHFKSGKDVMALYHRNFPDTRIMAGKGLVIGGSHQLNQLNTDSYYGDLSAVMLQNMPIMGQFLRTPDLSIALMDEWEAKIEKMAHSVIHDDVVQIAGVPTWTIVLIKRIFEITGATDLKQVWPNLELYVHGGVSFKPYISQFKKLIPDAGMHYMETYNASEGFFAAQDIVGQEGMLLFLNHGIFYEFMPMEELGKPEPRTLQLKDVEIGKNYAIIISTNAGLWRYLLGDTVKFVSLKPYRIIVSGRTKHYINAFGEEVMVDNTDKALAVACEKTGAIINDYTAAPSYFSENSNGCHEWIIEFEYLPVPLEVFVTEMDQALKAINSDYEAKRHKDIALRMPMVHVMPKNGFKDWLKSKGKLGGQHKVPRLSNERQYLDELLSFMKTCV